MILIGEQLPDIYVQALHCLGHTTLALPADPRLPAPVAAHPDMLLFLWDHTMITDRWYYNNLAKNVIDRACREANISLQLCDEPPGSHYPGDIRFNAAVIGQFLFCHPTHTSSAVLALADRMGLKTIPTKQGYSRCSICPVGDHALITADPAIATAAKKHDLDVLLIHPGHVTLPGYSHGFLGGCCGCFDQTLFFYGDLSRHPDNSKICDFLSTHGQSPLTVPGAPLFDAGSLFFLSRAIHEA